MRVNLRPERGSVSKLPSAAVGIACVLLLVACTSGNSGSTDPSPSEDTYSLPVTAPTDELDTEPPAPAEPTDSNLSDYATATDFNEAGSKLLDTLKCSQWLRVNSETREQAAVYYLLGLDDLNAADDAPSTAKLVTTTCKSYGDTETPKHIVTVAWNAANGGR